MKNWKISVILPTYNAAHFLSDALDSLSNQSMHDFEVIVVDDASSDNTADVVEKYRGLFPGRFQYVRLIERTGRGGVRNFGLVRSEATYIAFLDADDAYCPKKLELQSAYLDENPSVGGVACRYYYSIDSLEIRGIGTTAGNPLQELLGDHYSDFFEGTVAIMYRRELINQIGGFDKAIDRGQDLDLFVRAARRSRIDFIREPLFIYRQHDSNSVSIKGLMERTRSSLVLYKKIIATENPSSIHSARRFAAMRLKHQIYQLRGKSYFNSVKYWFLYLWKMNIDLPLITWCGFGVRVLIGYRFSRSLRKFFTFTSSFFTKITNRG